MRKLIKRTSSLSGIYAIGDLSVRGLRFFLLPLYTAYLTSDDYGILSIARVVTSIAVAGMSLGLNGAAFKFYYDFDGDQRKRFYGTLWIFLLVIPGLLLILTELVGPIIFKQVFRHVPYSPYLRLALWTSYFTIAFANLSRELLKASERAIPFILINLVRSVLIIGITIWLVAYLKMGAVGALYANFIGVAVTAFVSISIIRKYVSFSFDLSLIKKALLFGIPLIPHFLAHWVLAASDKVILERYTSLQQVGVYSVGYLLGSIMMLFVAACNNAIFPLFGRAKPIDDSQTRTLAKMTTYYVLAISSIGLCIALFSREVIYLAVPVSYHKAVSIVPWVVLGYFFMGLYSIPMGIVVLVISNTKPVSLYTTLAAVINIVLNILLIPRFGMKAAAITTAISYLVLFIGVFSFAHRTLPLPYEYRRISNILFVAILIFAAGWSLSPSGIWAGIVTKLLLLACFPLLLWLTGFLNEEEYKGIRRIVRQCLRI